MARGAVPSCHFGENCIKEVLAIKKCQPYIIDENRDPPLILQSNDKP